MLKLVVVYSWGDACLLYRFGRVGRLPFCSAPPVAVPPASSACSGVRGIHPLHTPNSKSRHDASNSNLELSGHFAYQNESYEIVLSKSDSCDWAIGRKENLIRVKA